MSTEPNCVIISGSGQHNREAMLEHVRVCLGPEGATMLEHFRNLEHKQPGRHDHAHLWSFPGREITLPQDRTVSCPELAEQCQQLAMRSLAPASVNNYQPWLRRYVIFAREFNLSLRLPSPVEDVQAFAVFIMDLGAKPGSVSMALAAISALHAIHNFVSPTITSPILHRVSRAMITSAKAAAVPKTPAPVAFMQAIANYTSDTYPPADLLRERLVLSMLFYGLMRPAEAVYLRACQFEWHEHEQLYMLHQGILKNHPKADARPAWVYNRGPYSAGFWLAQWLQHHHHYPGFHGRFCAVCPYLFATADIPRPAHSFLPAIISRWAEWTGFSYLHLSPSSFRAGGATAMANAGAALYTVQTAGQWKTSSTTRHYIRSEDHPQQEASRKLGEAVAHAPRSVHRKPRLTDERETSSLVVQLTVSPKRSRTAATTPIATASPSWYSQLNAEPTAEDERNAYAPATNTDAA